MRSAVLLGAVATRADEHLALAPRTQKQSGIVHRSPRRGGLDDPTSPGNTAYGAVRKCGSGRSLGRDRQVNRVRGCVGLFAESDLTPTPGRRHRGCARRQRPLISNIGSGGKQRHNSGGAAGTTQSAFALFWPIRLRRAVRRIRAPLRSHQHTSTPPPPSAGSPHGKDRCVRCAAGPRPFPSPAQRHARPRNESSPANPGSSGPRESSARARPGCACEGALRHPEQRRLEVRRTIPQSPASAS